MGVNRGMFDNLTHTTFELWHHNTQIWILNLDNLSDESRLVKIFNASYKQINVGNSPCRIAIYLNNTELTKDTAKHIVQLLY